MREQNPLSTANSFGGTTTEMEDRAAGGYWLNRSFISFATARSPFPTSPVGDVRDFRGCPTINGSKWCRIGFARSCHPVPKARTGASKMPLYARYGVPYVWLVDPVAKTLEVFTLEEGAWKATGAYRGQSVVRAELFAEIAIDLASLWA